MRGKIVLTVIVLVAIINAYFIGRYHIPKTVCPEVGNTTNNSHVLIDSTKVIETVKVDTFWRVSKPVVIKVPIKCPDGQLPNVIEIKEEGNGPKVSVKIDSLGNLNVTSDCDSMFNLVTTKNKELERKIITYDSTATVKVIKEKYIPRPYKFAMGVVVAESAYIIIKIYKYFKP